MDYAEFLKRKQFDDVAAGFQCERLNERLFPFQRALVRWALARGRAAILAYTGLGKTAMQVEWAHRVVEHTGGAALILAPLSVAHQTVAEAAMFGVHVEYHRSQPQNPSGILITNYEMLSRFNMSDFTAVVLDESSILKAYDGKTRTAILEACARVPYRLSCTATPSPNDYMELGNQAEFVGVMSRTEMLSMFFTHDGGDTSQWRLKGWGDTKFWAWMATWAVVIRKPSDLGFPDDGYDLPPLRVIEHIVESPYGAGDDLFGAPVIGLNEQRAAKRASLPARVQACADLVNRDDDPWLVWCHMNAESDALGSAIPDGKTVSGSDPMEHKEHVMDEFSDNALRVLISKPSICGFGMNWQHCANVAFVGLDNSFEQFYQAIRRCWRFGQTKQVTVHVFLSEQERGILDNIRKKESAHNDMGARMVDYMRTMMREKVMGTKIERAEYERDIARGDGWELHLSDCVDLASELAADSIHYTVFSPPFASLYTYSNSDRDMGNCKDYQEFAQHFQFLVRELFRVTMPGRLVSFHCMNLPTSKQHHGYIGIHDFRGDLIRSFEKEGWIYHSEVVIWKDPVTAMQRTKALGLLHKQLKKDSAMSRQGIPDYLVTMRKPGKNPEPVTKTNDSMPVSVWQRYASPVWMDVNPTRTLQFREARDNNDERHICPLQLDVIERSIELWSNPGDLILSPFAGIGSEGVVALRMGRRFVGSELKPSYWRVAVKNLQAERRQQQSLFEVA